MATYVLIPGAASDAWFWHRVAPLLQARGHRVVLPELPVEDDAAGLAEYADAVVAAVGELLERDGDLVVVAQSMGGFTAPLVCGRLPVRLMVLLAAMVPAPGESPGDWWGNTGQAEAKAELDRSEGRDPGADFDLSVTFFHDVPPEVTAEAMARPQRGQSDTPFAKPWPLDRWPDVPTRFLLARQDRLFPAAFQRRVVRDRLGITPDEMDDGHLVALSRPEELARRLEAYREGAGLR
ncbi:alpha/beta fold hydrolase [Streptacidiphilus carbonis]|uniref:alpha/beta fold hydrolase n=1 Tax=Streptacidiphilus carbonis TaxID=105422 RepID=UPI0005A8DB22|nr:alpha/beta hydrolase [Streptacidiphilus carbonis]